MKKSPPAKGKSTPKEKGTLFSFFSKAPSSSSKSTETPTKPKTAQDAKTVTTPSTAEASPEQSSGDSEDLVGKRVRVFWKDDGRWFTGKVVDYSLGKHTILYDDGDKEKVVLKNEKVGRACPQQWLNNHSTSCSSGGDCRYWYADFARHIVRKIRRNEHYGMRARETRSLFV